MKRKSLLIMGVVATIVIVAGSVLWSYHDDPQFCATCHLMDPYLESWNSPPSLANVHREAGQECLDCHPFKVTQAASEVVKYITRNHDTPLEERRMPQEECFRCHEVKTYSELARLTPITAESHLNPHESHYGELECGVCHKMHRTQVYYCAQCKDVGVMPEGWEAPLTP